jgi:mRNA interferase RelE/StbE
MRRVDFTRDALKVLQELPAKHARQVAEKIKQLAEGARDLPVKEIKGGEGFFRLTSGEYRIVFRVDHDKIQVWLIGRRNDDEVYKRFERKRGQAL